jgi:hypothetical protein
MLKIHGKEEYLSTDALLCDLKYIRDCVCLNMNPVFVLVRVEYVNRHLSIYTIKNSKLNFNQLKSDFEFKLDENNYKLMDQKGLEKILNSIIENKNKIEEVIKQNDKVMLLFYCLKFRNDFKELMSLVSNIRYTPFLIFNEWMEGKETIMKNQLLKKSTSIEKDEIESIRKAVENFMESCIKFCNYASTFFHWPFKLKEIKKIEEVKCHKLNDSKEKIRIYVESLSNLSDLINFETKYKYFYDNFSLELIFITFIKFRATVTYFIKLSIYYGPLKLDESKSKSMVYDARNSCICFFDLYVNYLILSNSFEFIFLLLQN